ncbi:MAG: hypothetical protein HC876_19735 [Chloroflexaceae bacterium]|nr:hypothetical protein [Chloroflexaceae bacterium]
MIWKGVEFPIAVLFLAGFGGASAAGVHLAVFLFTSNQELARLEQLPVVSAAGLRDSTTGREVLIEGRIDERSPVAESGLVAYHVEQLRENSDGDLEWRTTETIAPPLLVLLADGPVQVSGDYSLRNPPAEVTMSSDLRHTGFPVHTPLIAIGMIVDGLEGPELRAEFIAEGTRANFIAQAQTFAVSGAWVGGILSGIGVLLLAIGAVVLMRRNLR